MKKTYLIILLILICCFMNQFLSGQEMVKIWEKEFPSLEIEQTANLQRNNGRLDLDNDGLPDILGIFNNSIFLRMSSGVEMQLPSFYDEVEIHFQDYKFAGFYNFFQTENGLKQILMVKRDGNKIIGILIGVVREDKVDFNTPIPDEINNNESSIISIKDWNRNNFEEVKVTFEDITWHTINQHRKEYDKTLTKE